METMKKFSENEEDYDLYENRRMAILEANTIKRWKKELLAEIDNYRTELESKHAELEKERNEKARLLELLKQKGIDPES